MEKEGREEAIHCFPVNEWLLISPHIFLHEASQVAKSDVMKQGGVILPQGSTKY